MSFREELTEVKRKIKAAREYKLVCEQRIKDGLSLDDVPQYTSYTKMDKNHRSPEWNFVRRSFLMSHPFCAICGNQYIAKNVIGGLQVHHIMPFCLYPQLELDPQNLISLCGLDDFDGCHLHFGHPLGTQSYNPYIVQHAAILNKDFSRLEEVMEMANKAAVVI